MKVLAKRSILYGGHMYSKGEVIETGDMELIRRWRETGAVGLMGAELPEMAEESTAGADDTAGEAAEIEHMPQTQNKPMQEAHKAPAKAAGVTVKAAARKR